MMNKTLKKGKSNGVYILENVKIAYPEFWEPSNFYENAKGEPQYGCEIIFPKNSELEKSFVTLLKQIGDQTFGQLKYKIFILDGDAQKDINGMPSDNPKDYRLGSRYFKVKSKSTPSIYNSLGEKLTVNNGEIYGGCICRVFITIYPFNTSKLKGLGFNLLGVQKVKDSDPIMFNQSIDISEDIEIYTLDDDIIF